MNEARFGRSTSAWTERCPLPRSIRRTSASATASTRPIGLPQMLVAGGLNFGGPMQYPQGRSDASYVVVDTLQLSSGRHSMKLGGEYRHFLNENFAEGTGLFNFPERRGVSCRHRQRVQHHARRATEPHHQRAAGVVLQGRLALRSELTLELGLRYEWHVTPTERDDQFVVFDAGQRVAAPRRCRS